MSKYLLMVRMPKIAAAVAVLAAMLATGCGGGADAISEIVGTGGTGVISGSVTKGPVGNATVTAFAISGGQAGSQLGTAMTDASGGFTMSIGMYGGPVMLQASGGTYTDEATGQAMPMAVGDMMTAVLPSVTAGTSTTNVQVTPITAMAQAMAQRMIGGMSASNISAANAAMGTYAGVSDILHVQPMNPLTPGGGATASQDRRNYGMLLGAMSQYAKTLGMSSSSALVTAMMKDASDGMMDGLAGGAPIQMGMGGMMGGSSMLPATSGSSGLAAALTAYVNSNSNMSGLTASDMAALIQRLTTSGGTI